MKFLILALFLILNACGEGGNSSPAAVAPNYNGTYNLTTSNLRYVCEDDQGEFSGVTDGVDFDIEVSIQGENITGAVANSEKSFIGIMSGNEFRMQLLNFETALEDGTILSIDYEIEGAFQGNVWSGYYRSVAYDPSFNMTCAYEAVFNGSRV